MPSGLLYRDSVYYCETCGQRIVRGVNLSWRHVFIIPGEHPVRWDGTRHMSARVILVAAIEEAVNA